MSVHEQVLTICVHAVIRSARRCKHTLTHKETGHRFVCEAPAHFRKKTTASTSVFSCSACLPLHPYADLLDESPFRAEMMRLQACISLPEFDIDLYHASVQLLSKMHHTFDEEKGCPVCTWFPGPPCSASLADLANACSKFAKEEGLDPPDMSFIGDNLHKALEVLGQVPSCLPGALSQSARPDQQRKEDPMQDVKPRVFYAKGEQSVVDAMEQVVDCLDHIDLPVRITIECINRKDIPKGELEDTTKRTDPARSSRIAPCAPPTSSPP